MAKIAANGLELEYEDFGAKDAPVILLVMGLGAQLTLWPDEFVAALVTRGFRVIRYDNRDVGLSTKFDAAGLPNIRWMMIKALLGLKNRAPYSLSEMAADGMALMDALNIARAHVVGASMGGMIAQRMAAEHGERLLSLTSIMSTTSHRKLPQSRPEALRVLTHRPVSDDAEARIEFGMMAARAIGSPAYPADAARLRARVAADQQRSYYPPAFVRHMAAIIADGDRRGILAHVKIPTLVIHGTDDPLVPVEGGRDTAAHIAGAKLLEIPGMGHDLPLELVDQIADAIAEHARSVVSVAA